TRIGVGNNREGTALGDFCGLVAHAGETCRLIVALSKMAAIIAVIARQAAAGEQANNAGMCSIL
ncbi:MAG: hypothetical protein Q7U01_12665, partial [Pseudomonas sp.]|nr:hypothetical protein [Pseudomonas sp.]